MAKPVRVSLLMLFFSMVAAAQPKALFYMTRRPQSVRSFLAHADKIDVLVPTWYTLAPDGMVWGGPDPLVMRVAKRHHVPVMPIIGNAAVTQERFHKFLNDLSAREAMISSLLRECNRNGYFGIQIDFEDVNWKDAAALSDLMAATASVLHRAGYQLSIATVPNASGYPGQTAFSYWLYSHWRGAYDLAALAKYVDLICLMTYDQHTPYTPPGPVAGLPWTEENLDEALKLVPKAKLSLGIPLYGYHWYAGMPRGEQNRPHISAGSISAPDALLLAGSYDAQLEWDPVDQTAWFYFYRDDTREWVYYTDVRTFQARYDLVKKRGLEGFCSWVLGTEDPGIWNVLPAVHR
jgi:spore germination protein YaaH